MMAIETGASNSTQGAQASAASHALKSRGKQPADTGGGAFLALLSSLDGSAPETALGALAADAGSASDAGVQDDAANTNGLVADPAGLGMSTGAPAMDATAGPAPTDAGGTAGAGRPLGRLGTHPERGAAAAQAMADSLASVPAGRAQVPNAEAQPVEPDSIAELVAGLTLPAATAEADIGSASTAAHTATVRLAARNDDAAPSATKVASARAAQAFDPSRAMTAVGGLVRANSNAAIDVRDGKSVSTVSLAQGGAPSASITAALQATVETRDANLSDKGGDKSGAGHPSWLAGGALTPTERAVGGMAGAAGDVRFADVAASQQLAPDDMLAQQVSVWASGKAQSAELKLDGFGEQPIEVSIALNGNEAEVAFRSDHALARDLLQSALPELREMLRNEGLVLSGMTVGTSDRGAAQPGGQQAGNERQDDGGGGRRDVAAPVTAAMPARPVRPQGVVDVFA
jgi:flagellar hook-length control protein FliK